MTATLYYSCPYVPFIIDLLVIIPFWRLVTVIDTHDYLAIYMIAVNIPYTIRLVPQYINILAPVAKAATKFNATRPLPQPPPPPLGTIPNQAFFSMMSAFVVITVCYGAFNVLISMLQEIRRGKPSKWHLWLPFGAMMVITQAVLIAIYKYDFLSESIILFLVIYYIFICAVMTFVVTVFLRRERPNDPLWEKRRQSIKSRLRRFLLFGLIIVVPSVLYMHHLSIRFVEWLVEVNETDAPATYNFTDYMFHPWVFNMVGMLLLDPFRKVTLGHLRPFGAYYRRYRGSFHGPSPTLPAVYRVPPPSYTDITQKSKPLRPLQMY